MMRLPWLKRLDVRGCPFVSWKGLDWVRECEVVVRWDEFVVKEVEERWKGKQVMIVNVGGGTK